jgi:IclR family transcriptional regulator, acetate operon repressor
LGKALHVVSAVKKSATKKSAATGSAAGRSLAILELLAAHPKGIGIVEIGAQLALPKSGAHRLLAVLVASGYVRQDAGDLRYALTLKLAAMGMRHYAGLGLSDVAQPILDRLAAESGELARLAIVENERMLWIAKAQGARHGLRYDPDTGADVVLHATAVGRAWLATLPEKQALRIVAATGFATPAHFGPNAVRALEPFKTALGETRARGYGVAIEEGEAGAAAIAAAFRASPEPGAAVAGTLSLAGPVGRFLPTRRAAFARLLAAATKELTALWPARSMLRARPPGPREDLAHAG